MQWRNEPSTCIGQAQHLQFKKRKLFVFFSSVLFQTACLLGWLSLAGLLTFDGFLGHWETNLSFKRRGEGPRGQFEGVRKECIKAANKRMALPGFHPMEGFSKPTYPGTHPTHSSPLYKSRERVPLQSH